jgi:hypothetical protein
LNGLWCAAQSPGMDDDVDRPEPPSAKAVTARAIVKTCG